jgi:propanediol dehydratase small subunit
MNNEQLIESVVREVLNSMEKGITTKSTKQTSSNSNILHHSRNPLQKSA